MTFVVVHTIYQYNQKKSLTQLFVINIILFMRSISLMVNRFCRNMQNVRKNESIFYNNTLIFHCILIMVITD